MERSTKPVGVSLVARKLVDVVELVILVITIGVYGPSGSMRQRGLFQYVCSFLLPVGLSQDV